MNSSFSSTESDRFPLTTILTGPGRGFIAKASTEAIDSIHSLSQDYMPTIEDDQTVTTQG